MSPKEIIEFVLHKEELTYYALAKAMGLGRAQALYDIRDGKVKAISGNFAKKIIEAFPTSGYTLPFLLTGDEQLLEMKDESDEKVEKGKKMNAITQRFLKAVDTLGISDYRVSTTVEGLKKENMSKIRRGVIDVSVKILSPFCKVYTSIDANWLLTGEGSMLKSKAQPTTSLPPPPTESPLSDDQEELETKDEVIKRLRNQIEFFEDQIKFLKEVIKTKEDRIVDKDFTINDLTKKLKKYEEDTTNQSRITKQEKSA